MQPLEHMLRVLRCLLLARQLASLWWCLTLCCQAASAAHGTAALACRCLRVLLTQRRLLCVDAVQAETADFRIRLAGQKQLKAGVLCHVRQEVRPLIVVHERLAQSQPARRTMDRVRIFHDDAMHVRGLLRAAAAEALDAEHNALRLERSAAAAHRTCRGIVILQTSKATTC